MPASRQDGGRQLLLFDIDCTLIDAGGAGMSALRSAAAEVFSSAGGEVPLLDLAGSTDSGIVRGLYAHFGLVHTAAAEAAFYERYLPLLEANLADPSFGGRVLDGVPELLAELALGGRHICGILTGNIARGAEIKLRHFGLGEHFRFGAYGDDHHDRNRLGPVALERALAAHGRSFSGEQTVVIGDTPKDIACGKAFGATTIGVATGKFSAAELEACHPDAVIGGFGDLPAAMAHF